METFERMEVIGMGALDYTVGYGNCTHVVLPELCKKRGISIYELAQEIDEPDRTLYGWVNGATPTGGKTLSKVCKFFRIEPCYLLYGIRSFIQLEPIKKRKKAVNQNQLSLFKEDSEDGN